MNEESQWVAFSERQPQKSDYPIWLYSRRNVGAVVSVRPADSHLPHYDYWAQCVAPEPPKREPSQEELDEVAWREWALDIRGCPSHKESWFAGVAWERAALRSLLSDALPQDASNEPDYAALRELRRKLASRVGP